MGSYPFPLQIRSTVAELRRLICLTNRRRIVVVSFIVGADEIVDICRDIIIRIGFCNNRPVECIPNVRLMNRKDTRDEHRRDADSRRDPAKMKPREKRRARRLLFANLPNDITCEERRCLRLGCLAEQIPKLWIVVAVHRVWY
jgi:hypothetical protein